MAEFNRELGAVVTFVNVHRSWFREKPVRSVVRSRKVVSLMSMDWASVHGQLECVGWFARIGIGTITVVQYSYLPLPAASAVGLQDLLPKPSSVRFLTKPATKELAMSIPCDS